MWESFLIEMRCRFLLAGQLSGSCKLMAILLHMPLADMQRHIHISDDCNKTLYDTTAGKMLLRKRVNIITANCALIPKLPYA